MTVFGLARHGAFGSVLEPKRRNAGRSDVMGSGQSVEPGVLLAGASTMLDPAAQSPKLTRRELDIVRLVAADMRNKQIADQLQISEWTVGTHMRRIFAKLGVRSRAAMISKAMNVSAE